MSKQHTVIIDGQELSPVHANAAVLAIEEQFSMGLTNMFERDVDDEEKHHMAPHVLTLAEILAKIDPQFAPEGIDIVEGVADFSGELSRFGID